MHSSLRNLLIASACGAIIVLGGCSSTTQKTQKQEVTQEWNAARAAVLFSLASDQYKTGNLDTARKSIDDAAALDPQNAAIRVLSARLDIEQGKLENAQSTLALAGKLDPKNAEVDYLQGVIHQRWQKPQAAADCYASASAKKPDDLAYLLAQAEMLVQMSHRDAALELLLSRVVYFEHSGTIRDAIAQLFEQQGDEEKALDYYRQASVLATDDDGIRERLALALYRQGQWADALSQLSRLLKQDSFAGRADLMVAAAECDLQLGRALAARERFDKATYEQPSNASAWLGAAKASLRLNDLRRADIAANRAIALTPADEQAYLLLGLVRMKQGRSDDAMKVFQKANMIEPTDPTPLCMMGLINARAGNKEAAMNYYGKALALAPNDELAGRLFAEAKSGR